MCFGHERRGCIDPATVCLCLLSAVGVWTSKKEKRMKYRANKTNYEIREIAATRQNKLREHKTPINGENDQLLGIRNKKTEQPPTEQT